MIRTRWSVSAAVGVAALYCLLAAVRWIFPALLPSLAAHLELPLVAALAGTLLWVLRTTKGWPRRGALAAVTSALVLRACVFSVDATRIFERAPELYDAAVQSARQHLPREPGCAYADLPARFAETARLGRVVLCRGPAAEEFLVFVSELHFVGEYRGFMYYAGSRERPRPWVVPWTLSDWRDPGEAAPGPGVQGGWARPLRPHWYRVGT